jgi:hypothetical protein
MKSLTSSILLAGLFALPLFSSAASAEQFFAEQDSGGAVNVVDAAGAPVSIVYGDPVGSRPDLCPSGSYYFTELDTDRAQLVLTDCATGQGNYPVTIGSAN